MQIERSPADMLYTDTYIGYRIEDKRKTTAEVDNIWDDCSALEIALSETTRLAEDRRVWRSAIFNLGCQRLATLSSSSEHYKNSRRRRHEQIDGTGCIKISASSTYRPDTFVVTYRWCSTVHTCVGPTDDTKQDKSADCRALSRSHRGQGSDSDVIDAAASARNVVNQQLGRRSKTSLDEKIYSAAAAR